MSFHSEKALGFLRTYFRGSLVLEENLRFKRLGLQLKTTAKLSQYSKIQRNTNIQTTTQHAIYIIPKQTNKFNSLLKALTHSPTFLAMVRATVAEVELHRVTPLNNLVTHKVEIKLHCVSGP